ncbi:MAG: cadmium-translocating P-type ATPase [Clostridia bacterium]|nr:cadmium-translocating P-type ATPase [Clostridia bacterium]
MGCSCGHNHEKEKSCACHGHEHEREHEHTGCCHGDHAPSCGCHHQKNSRREGILLALGALFLACGIFLPLMPPFPLIFYLAALLLCGYPVFRAAAKNILHGEIFDEMLLMALASLGAFAIGEYAEGVMVLLLFQIGEMLQHRAVEKSRASIRALSDIRPDFALMEEKGQLRKVSLGDVAPGDVIIVRPGDRIPLDGEIIAGESLLDTAALTGESLPRPIREGERALSGCINLSSPLRIRVTHPYHQSTVSRILTLMEEAEQKKSRAARMITRFAKVYTPIVVISALLIFLIPVLLFRQDLQHWAHAALSFLVISCPCALVISVPLTYFAGIGAASRAGMLVKGGSDLEMLSRAEIIALDKTGTLTRGEFSLTGIFPIGMEKDQLLSLAAAAESMSTHPIARSVAAAWKGEMKKAENIREISGQGVCALVEGKRIAVGNERLMDAFGVALPRERPEGIALYAAVNEKYAGYLLLQDTLKLGAKEAVRQLKALGIRKILMLTGDTWEAARKTAEEAGMEEIHAGLLPQDKVALIEKAMEEKGKKGALIFLGDGINDAPVLARADTGVAMGGMGSAAAIEAADGVIMDDDLQKLPRAIRIARKTQRIVYQNILFSLLVKLAVMGLNLIFSLPLWICVFADVGVCMLAILNALRAMGWGRANKSS